MTNPLKRCLLAMPALFYWVIPAAFAAQPALAPIGKPGAYTGFEFTSAAGQTVGVTFGSVGNITAGKAEVEKKGGARSLRFTEFAAAPTPTLGRESHVTVTLREGDPFPLVEFRFEIEAFDQAAWEKAMGKVPFHFLCCRVEGAEIFHQRGWPIPTPVIDPYPLLNKGTGYGRQIVSNWSQDWTYAPPIGAYPLATVGLWTPSKRQYVGFDFHAARLTDHSAKDVGTSYCWKFKDTGQFFALVWPYASPYQDLRYPKPSVIDTRFHILHSADMPSDDDPNLFVTKFIWSRFRDLMPGVTRMNDLSWLSNSYRLSAFPKPFVPRLYRRIKGTEKRRWWKGGTLVCGGVAWDGDPVSYLYETKQTARIAQLKKDIDFLLPYAKRFKVGGDDCVFWMKPLEGEAIDLFGPAGVPTIHNIQGWQVALTLLDVARNDPALAPKLLPYVDGALRFTRHILYTRNGYADVPCAQFCWGAGPVTSFCLRYYYTFRNDPERRGLAEQARKLARVMLYRYLPIWCSDSNDLDDLDSSFMLEPNSGISWLGAACSNEVGVVPHAVAQVYVATGDEVLGHYLRGMLERWHELYRDEWRPRLADYDGALTERLGLYPGSAQAPGTRATYGGLSGLFERYGWPVGQARVRVLCGEAAAMAFDKQGKHTDIADYRYYGDGRFSLKLVPITDAVDTDEPFDACLTFPYFDLRRTPVWLVRHGKRIELKADRALRFDERPDSVYVKRVQYGDIVAVGKHDPMAPTLPCRVARVRTPARGRRVGGFHCVDMAGMCNTRPKFDWDNVASLAGYEPGSKALFGAPFDLVDPLLNKGQVCARDTSLKLEDGADFAFLLVSGAKPGAKLELVMAKGTRQAVDLAAAAPAQRGWPPCFDWRIDLVAVDLRGKRARAIAWNGMSVFAVTTFHGPESALARTMAALKGSRDLVAAEREAVGKLAGLQALFKEHSGRIAVLPDPALKNPYSAPIVKILHRAGLLKHVVMLRPGDLVNPAVFSARRFWCALYIGGERYWQSVRRPGDGDDAIVRYLAGGGTLALLPYQPFPFYYDQDGKVALGARKFGIPICGSGAGRRPDKLEGASTSGWERPPKRVKLAFHVRPGQQIVQSIAKQFPFPTQRPADPRWRPIVDWLPAGNRYVPALTLRDAAGKSYGEAVALIEFGKGPLAGGRVLYVWSSLLKVRAVAANLLADVLGYAVRTSAAPPERGICPHATTAPKIDGSLDDAAWAGIAPMPFTRFHPGKGSPAYPTEARLCWDDDNLYAAFAATDPDIWSAIRDRDGDLWKGEVVELYVDPDGDGRHYKEFEVNPLGAVVDLDIARVADGRVADVAAFKRWNAKGWRTAVKVEGTVGNRADKDKRWAVEMAIPWANFPTAQRRPPKVGDAWRVQLLRIDRSNTLEQPEYSAWSPTDTFHRPRRFGKLVFGAPAASDDFSLYADGSTPSPNWTVQAGRWRVENGALMGEDSGTDGWRALGIAWGDSSWRDYTLSVRFKVDSAAGDWRDGPWFGFRCDDAGNGYYLTFSNRDVQLHKVSNGRGTTDSNPLARAPWKPDGQWHTLVVTADTRFIAARIVGESKDLVRVTDSDLAGLPPVYAGRVVLSARKWSRSPGHTRVRFDDVKVKLLK